MFTNAQDVVATTTIISLSFAAIVDLLLLSLFGVMMVSWVVNK